MNKFKSLLVAVSVVLACGSIAIADNNDKAKLEASLANANTQYKLALKSKFAWTKTGGILKKAKAAMEKGNHAAAKKLISKALSQANNSLAQAKDSKDNWQKYIPKNR